MILSGSGETGMNGSGSLSNLENLTSFEGLPLQGLSEARRAGSFFLVANPPQGRPVLGRWHSSHQRKRMLTIPASNLNTMIFTGNAPLRAKRSTGVSLPHACGSPDAITPEQVIWSHRSAQGWYGGTGTVPSFIEPVLCISFIAKQILQSLFIRFL